MPLQFRRGHSDDLPPPSDAAVGEPLFTTDDGKLRIKKADGNYAVIGSGTSSPGNLDLSSIEAGSLVKVNSGRDGFDQASGADIPSHTHPISAIENLQDTLNNKAFTTHTHTADAITEGTIPAGVQFPTGENTGFTNAVANRLLEELPATNGVLDIAKQSTLEAFIADWPTDANGDLDIAQQTTLLALQDDVDALDYLTAFFTDAALPATPGSTGFLKYDADASPPAWSLVANTASAPTEINGGNATSFAD